MIGHIIWIIVLTICIVIDVFGFINAINSKQRPLIIGEIVAIALCAVAIALHIVSICIIRS